MNERGEYRALFVSLADDPEAHSLSGDAFKLLVMLKLSLPVTGLGAVYLSKLCDQVNVDRDRLEHCLVELETPKPGRDYGWIVRESNVVWLVNALRFESNLRPANAKKHVPFVNRLISQVNSSLKIVAKFKAYYPRWFQHDAQASPKARDRVSNPIAASVAVTAPIAVPITTTKSGKDLDQERGDRAGAASAPLAAALPLADALAQLPKGALDFLRAFYPRQVGTERRTDVARQLLATLNGGAEFRGQRVRAMSVERLVARCRDVQREGMRDPDKAIAVLLIKLADTSDDSAPGVQEAATTAAEIARDEAATADELAHAERWLEEHIDIAAQIADQLERDGFPEGHLGRRFAERGYVLTAWRHAGAPEVSHV